jgi:hypothetical protein
VTGSEVHDGYAMVAEKKRCTNATEKITKGLFPEMKTKRLSAGGLHCLRHGEGRSLPLRCRA